MRGDRVRTLYRLRHSRLRHRRPGRLLLTQNPLDGASVYLDAVTNKMHSDRAGTEFDLHAQLAKLMHRPANTVG